MIDFKHYRPAPDLLRERVILVTGAGQGIGRVARSRSRRTARR